MSELDGFLCCFSIENEYNPAIDIMFSCKIYHDTNNRYQRNRRKKILVLRDTSKFKQMRQIYLEKSEREFEPTTRIILFAEQQTPEC